MINIRIVELPEMKVATSGLIRSPEDMERFISWWTEYDKSVACKIAPRDFMLFNEREQLTEWYYVLPADNADEYHGGYEIKTYPFGLYAVASNIDADCDRGEDWMATKAALEAFARENEYVEPSTPDNDVCERWTMFHIVTPAGWFERTGIHQQDMYYPIVYRK